jgi:hypothetical protein
VVRLWGWNKIKRRKLIRKGPSAGATRPLAAAIGVFVRGRSESRDSCWEPRLIG